jgi:signal transduction histidine kinase/ActR/RegA family two-component response regulator
MTTRRRNAEGRKPLSRTLYDMAQVLESAEGSEARVLHVVELLQEIVPYDQCALLEAQPGREPRLVVVPGAPPDERALLTEMLMSLFGQLLEDHGRPPEASPRPSGAHLAVPLVGLDQVIGVLYVRGPEGAYEARHLRALSVVGAKLAAYFTMLRARAEEAARTRQLEEARRAAEAANRAKDQFLALVSHELKTPLTSTLTWVHVMRSKDVGEAERARAVEAIERNLRAQAKLIDDLLELSCIATAEVRLDLRAVEPARLIKAAVEDLRPRAAQRSIRLKAALDRSVKLLVDPDRLDHVVAILLANAIESTPNGGHVEVQLGRAGAHARIRVTDSGKGISPDFLPHLFERFGQGEGSSTRTSGGLGLGLAIVKHLVELHGGRVRAESPGEEKGATFTVELPLAGAAPEVPARPEAPDAGERGEKRALTGIRVLIVDADAEIRDALKFLLERYGAAVTAAGSAAEALAALERSMPDVLLSDVALPGESGYELMRKVAAREGGGALPAAALSGFSREQDRQRALAAGFRMHLEKPVEPEALIAAVARLAGRTVTKDARAARMR